ncbi:CRTAC1 family protein, partial [Acidobacteria bacterium AH-259-G07]|nr:CRTAC1 family protein [Acidobacteria bacterium AH-259-G07]
LTLYFVDIAERAGLDFQHVSGSPEKKYILETISGGVAWIDYNRDHWPDLYLVNGGSWEELLEGKRTVSNALYRNNRDGTFTNVTESAGVGGSRWGMGATIGDYNNDGWPDLYVCNYGSNTLYRNNGDGTFTDVTLLAGVGDDHWSSSAAFADYDADGWLDLYVVNYIEFDYRRAPAPACQYRGIQVHCGPEGMTAASDVLYRNKGDGTFVQVTRSAGMAQVLPSYGLGLVWTDYDNDGDIDLYVANDSMANFLFRNHGEGTFEEVGLLSGVGFSEDGNAQAGMGLATADYDHDGALDFYVTNFSDDYNTLYRNMGSGFFRDVSYASGVAFASWQFLSWGTQFFDFDNDGWEDIFVSNGHIYPQVDDYQIGTHFYQRKLVFQNLGNGKFKEVAEALGSDLSKLWSSRGAAFADFDNDGDVDIAVNNMDDRPSLLRNEGGSGAGHWLTLALEGVRTNRSAIGVRVTLETEKGRQLREVQGGSSYQSTNDFRLHFGLGASQKVKEVVVKWTNGVLQEFEDLVADHSYHLKEGGTLRAGDK